MYSLSIVKRFFVFILIVFPLSSCDFLIGPMMEGAGTSPDKIEGLALWLRADKGVYSDAGCTIAAGNGETVNCWQDQSMFSNNVDSVYSSSPILFKSNNIFNGHAILNFAGDCSFGNDTSSGLSINSTIFSVTQTNMVGDRALFQLNGSPSHGHWISNTNTYSGYLDGSNLSSRTIGRVVLFDTIYNNGDFKIFENGKRDFSYYFPPSEPSPPLSYQVGGVSTDFLLAEILVYNRPLSDSERQDVEVYLGKKYGIDPAE